MLTLNNVGVAFSGYNVLYKFTTNKFRVTNPLYVITVNDGDTALIRPIASKSLFSGNL